MTKLQGSSSLAELFQQQREQILKDYFTLLRFQSISAEEEYAGELIACSEWIANYLRQMGLQVEIWKTSSYPVVYAEDLRAGKDKPTLLFYGHYDVQPVDPLDKWLSPPFEPTVRNGEVFARGAQDNKGQLFYVLNAVRLLLQRDGALPINLKMCIEGEEENKSHGLAGILSARKEKLKADYMAVADFDIPDRNTPALTLGVRGLCALTVEIEGSNTDLHSGQHGGIAYNPNHALVELLAKVRDANGRILIPGFYDDVEELSASQRERLNMNFDAKLYEKTFAAQPIGGEKGFSPHESNWLRPTFEINGLSGGYGGLGFKTVIPAKAMAKISCRLVPKQDPDKVSAQVASFLKQHCPKGLKLTVTEHGGGKPARGDPDSPIARATADAYQEIFGAPCQLILSGGSIPISADLAETSGAEIVYFGTGLPDDQIHAPNEHFGLDRFEKGFHLVTRMIERLIDMR